MAQILGGSLTLHFYPRPPRGGRPVVNAKSELPKSDFYPRPPRGGRQVHEAMDKYIDEFLSTPSARRATKS